MGKSRLTAIDRTTRASLLLLGQRRPSDRFPLSPGLSPAATTEPPSIQTTDASVVAPNADNLTHSPPRASILGELDFDVSSEEIAPAVNENTLSETPGAIRPYTVSVTTRKVDLRRTATWLSHTPRPMRMGMVGGLHILYG